jgi:hypothetical protein
MRPDRPALFDIWEEPGDVNPVKLQLVNYVGSFPTREKAESFANTTRMYRAQEAKAAPAKKGK